MSTLLENLQKINENIVGADNEDGHLMIIANMEVSAQSLSRSLRIAGLEPEEITVDFKNKVIKASIF